MPMPPMPLDSNNTTSRRRPVALVSFVVPCQFPRSGDAWMFGTSDGWDQDHRIAAWEAFNVRRTCSCQTFQNVTVTCWLYINRNEHSDIIAHNCFSFLSLLVPGIQFKRLSTSMEAIWALLLFHCSTGQGDLKIYRCTICKPGQTLCCLARENHSQACAKALQEKKTWIILADNRDILLLSNLASSWTVPGHGRRPIASQIKTAQGTRGTDTMAKWKSWVLQMMHILYSKCIKHGEVCQKYIKSSRSWWNSIF